MNNNGVSTLQIKTIGIIGAGQMGNGIAHVGALAGRDIRLLDVEQEQLDKAMATIDKNMDRQVRRESISADEKAAALARIKRNRQIHAIFGALAAH